MIKDSKGMDEMKNPCLLLKTHIFQVITFEEGYTVIHPYYSNFKPPFPAARF